MAGHHHGQDGLCRLVRIDWDTTGRIIERVMATGLDRSGLDNLFVCGADEVSWRKGHSYLTLVSNNDTGKFVWGKEGKDTATLDCFFDELGEERSGAITAMSMDMGPSFEKSARKEGHAVNAVIASTPSTWCRPGPGIGEGPSPGLAGLEEASRPRCCAPVQGGSVVLIEKPRRPERRPVGHTPQDQAQRR